MANETSGRQDKHSMVVRVTREDLAKVHAIALDVGETISVVVRRWLREAYAVRFGEAPPPEPRLKNAPRPAKPRRSRR